MTRGINLSHSSLHRPVAWRWFACALLTVVTLAGCGSPDAQFKTNRVFIAKELGEELSGEARDDRTKQLQTVNTALTAMFGVPDDAFVVPDAELGVTDVIDPALLPMAAGPVGRDENGFARGLYRQHCAHCHGVTGDGAGPTAPFLNPYPRDFRMGKFKFKSTPLGEKPTNDDLEKILVHGIPGTAMPSFKVLLAKDERDAVINYVKYLAVRGEVERKLVTELTFLDPDEPLETTKDLLVDTVLADVVGKWAQADEFVTPVPASSKTPDVARGKILFQGKDANCFSCHGVTALGDGLVDGYDEWTTDYADWANILVPEQKAEKFAEYAALSGLPARPNRPRNLRRGVYRGGRRPIDLYWRIKNGIEGAPMPAAAVQQTPGGPGLSEDDIWDLIAYVRHLPYETISQPPPAVLENLRENP